MYKAVTVLFIALTMAGHGTAIAEPVTVAYAGDSNGMLDNYRDSLVDNIDPVLHKHMYEIQQETSSMKLLVNSPIGDISVSFGDFSGDFMMHGNDENRDVASIEVNAENMDTSRGMVGRLLKSEAFLDVDSFPSMRFVGTSFEWFSEHQAILKGDMTIKGTTQQVAFYVELVDKGPQRTYSDRVELQATAIIKRSSFGIKTLLPIVSDDVSLYISINAIRKISYSLK